MPSLFIRILANLIFAYRLVGMACFRLLAQLTARRSTEALCAVLVRLDSLGDALVSCHTLQAYKEFFASKGLPVILVCSGTMSSFYENAPFYDEIILVDMPLFRKSFRYRWTLCRRLAARNPKYAVKMTTIFGSGDADAILAIGMGAEMTCGVLPKPYYSPNAEGMDEPVCMSNATGFRRWRQRFLTKRDKLLLSDYCYHRPFGRFFNVSVEGRPLESVQMAECRLFRKVTGNEAYLPESLPPFWLATGKLSSVHPQRYLIVPGASVLARAWPTTGFAGLVDRIHAWRPELEAVICGIQKERELADELIANVRSGAMVTNGCGHNSLQDLHALIQSAEFVISNDTGPAHFAAAMGKPTFVIMGYGQYNGEAGLYFPNPSFSNATCISKFPAPECRLCCWLCHRMEKGKFPCLSSLTPDEAWEQISPVLERVVPDGQKEDEA